MTTVRSHVQEFHLAIRARVGARLGQPEAQLTAPVETLISNVAAALNRAAHTFPEATTFLREVRPDLGVTVDGLLSGHIELKATGKGADPSRYTGHDRRQWAKLRELPNLLLTDGAEWALYRTGVRVGGVRLPDLADTPSRVPDGDADLLGRLIFEFLDWAPIVPSGPEQLAQVLAPLARIVRDEVLVAVARPGSAIAQLAADWRHVLFPDASDDEFADAYAQTLTYAMLLARLDPATAVTGILTTLRASEALEAGHGLLAQALRLLSEPAARAEISTGVGLLERAIGAVDPARVTGTAKNDVWLYFYELFLGEYDPRLREERGVYYTPVEVVRAQVRLVGHLLAERFDKARSYAEDDVVFLDPAVGTGTYPLAAIDHALEVVEQRSGPGAVAGRAGVLARNLHAFELLVGPYTVAHLRITPDPPMVRVDSAVGTRKQVPF